MFLVRSGPHEGGFSHQAPPFSDCIFLLLALKRYGLVAQKNGFCCVARLNYVIFGAQDKLASYAWVLASRQELGAIVMEHPCSSAYVSVSSVGMDERLYVLSF